MSLENSQFDPNGGNKNTRACVGVDNAKILLKIDQNRSSQNSVNIREINEIKNIFDIINNNIQFLLS